MKWNKINYDNLEKAAYGCNKTDYKILRDFLINNEIIAIRNPSWIGTTIKRFLELGGKSCGKTYINLKTEIPNIIDHCRLYKNKKAEVFIVSHSYLPIKKIIEEFNAWNDGNFTLHIFGSEKSWYWPGNTNLLIITLVNVKVNF
ncbi:MAG: hypothetical protein IJV94_04625 [Bacilli bacterium]|nr:hypothetical protein [Bacilli bacterium]